MIKSDQSSPGKLAKFSAGKISLCAGMIALSCVLVFLFVPNAWLDGFLKNQITRALRGAYPAYSIQIAEMHYNSLKNRLECDSIRIMKNDSTVSFTVSRLSVSGFDRTNLFLGRSFTLDELKSSQADIEDILVTFNQSEYELRCAHLRISVPDSTLMIAQLELHPLVSDERFFEKSKFRKTRFSLDIPQCRVTALNCLELLQKKSYRARAVQVYGLSLNVLINKDKPYNFNSASPRMPNVILSSIKESIQIDSIGIMNGQLLYYERFHVGSKPGVVSFDSVQLNAEGIGNTAERNGNAVIQGQAIFMKTNILSVQMSMPIESPELSYRFSGSLSQGNLTEFNPFIEIAEDKRLKTGYLYSAAFSINVTAGRASGIVHAKYKDWKIALLNDRTGSENGIGNRVLSFLVNKFKFRTSNMPDKSGSMKTGEVKYDKKSDEAFLEFTWFAIRSGVGEIVGF